MEPSTGTVEQALDLAKRGMAYEACERLWPLVRDPETRDEAVFTLAYCFERANNLPTAAYLYGWVADRHPEFNVAARRVAKCRAELENRGLHEDFSDSGHVDCACGHFRYRAELGLCPYCGQTSSPQPDSMADAAADAPPSERAAADRERPDDALIRIREDLDRAWKRIQARFDEFTHREDLTGPAQHAQVLARELTERAKNFTQSDAARSMREAAASEEANEARTKLEKWTREAADRIEEFARSERVQSAGKTAYTTLERIVARIQSVIDDIKGVKSPPPTSEAESGDGEDRPPQS